MGKKGIYNTTGWAMIIAYISLLAHVFVPHHHHGAGMAFLNHKACPHEPYSCAEEVPDQDGPANRAAGECETLKHTWLKTSSPDDYRTKPPVTFIWADIPVTGHIVTPTTITGKRIRVHWRWGPSNSNYKTPIGLRGPPLFNS